MERYLEYCKYQRGLSTKTIRAYKLDIGQYLSYCTEQGSNKLEKSTLVDYITYLHRVYKPRSAKRKIASLKAYFNYLTYIDEIEINPFSRIRINYKEPKMLPKTIDFSELQSLFEKVYYYGNPLERVLFELLFATGGRIAEICSLRVSDVNLEEKYVDIFGKGSKERRINIPNTEVIKALKVYLKGRKYKSEYLLVNNRGNRLSEQSARRIVKRYSIMAGIKGGITPHILRHTVATLLLENDVDIRYIQHILGHSSISTTQIYTHISTKKQRKILEIKHPRNKLKI